MGVPPKFLKNQTYFYQFSFDETLVVLTGCRGHAGAEGASGKGLVGKGCLIWKIGLRIGVGMARGVRFGKSDYGLGVVWQGVSDLENRTTEGLAGGARGVAVGGGATYT